MKNKAANLLFAGILAVTLAVAGSIAPLTSAQAASAKTVTVTDEMQLKAALKNNKVTKIIIKTSKNVTITIPVGEYEKKQLVIDAQKATINNKGVFKSITISDAKKYTEKGSANKITIKDNNSLSFVESAAATATQVTVSQNGTKLTVTDNGELTALKIKAKTSLTVKGSSKSTPVAVSKDGSTLNIQKPASVKLSADVPTIVVRADAKVTVADAAELGKVVVNSAANVTLDGATTNTIAVVVNADGAKVNAATMVDVAANAKAEVNLSEGAEGSKIFVAEGADVTVNNKTTRAIDVTMADGITKKVAAGASMKTGEWTKSSEDKKDDANASASGSYAPPAQALSNFTVKSVEASDDTTIHVEMSEMEGVTFTVDDVAVNSQYEGDKYKLTVAAMKGGAHSVKLSKSGYNTCTSTVKYAPKPEIYLSPSGNAEDVYVSDVETLTERTVTVTNYLPNTATIETTYYKTDVQDNNKLESWAAAKAYLKTKSDDASDIKVVVKYVATYIGKTSDAKTVTYTAKKDAARDIEVSDITYTGNSKETALANGGGIDASNIKGTAKCGGVDIAGTWSFTDKNTTTLSASKSVGVTFTPTDTGLYNTNTYGTVYIYVKAATPSQLPLETSDLNLISYGKVKFTTPADFNNIQYRIGTDGAWTDASDAEFDAKAGDQIYFRTKANTDGGDDGADGYVVNSDASEPIIVDKKNIGTKTIQLKAPTALSNVSLDMGAKTLTFDAYTNFNDDAAHVASYLIKVYQEDTLTATATVAANAATAMLTMEALAQFAYDKDYTVTITAKAGESTGYLDSAETNKSGVIAVSDRVTVTFHTGNGSAIDPIRMQKGTKVSRRRYNPVNKGHAFVNWYTDQTYMTVFDFEQTTVAADTTIYALWSKELDEETSVSFAFPSGLTSSTEELFDDEAQRLDQIIDGYDKEQHVKWTGSDIKCIKVSGTLKAGKSGAAPIFVTLDLSGVTYDGLAVEANGELADRWIRDHSSAADWKSKLAVQGDKLYIKLEHHLTNEDGKSSDSLTYWIYVRNGLGGDDTKAGYEVARLAFIISSAVVKGAS